MPFRRRSSMASSLLATFLACCLAPLVQAEMLWWNSTLPTAGTNCKTNLLSWQSGLLKDLEEFGIEMQRLSVAGYHRSHTTPEHIHRQRPHGRHYCVMFLNWTGGTLYATSDAFTVASTGTTTSDPNAPTVSLTHKPNTIEQYAATFSSSGLRGWTLSQGSSLQLLVALCAVPLACWAVC